MLVLSTRQNEKIFLPDVATAIEVVAIAADSVRLGISAPEYARVIRQGSPGRDAEWTPCPAADETPTLDQIRQLMDRRLEIARTGLSEVRQLLDAGDQEQARLVMEKVDEDLSLLRRRVRRELERADLAAESLSL